MATADLAIATMTLVRDGNEQRLLTEALSALAAHGIPMFVADGGSPEPFVAELRALAGTTLVEPAGRGLVHQVRAAVHAATASGARRVLYTEPDKLTFFERHLADFLATSRNRAGVVLAARNDDALATFSPTQRATETAINAVAAELTRRPGDYCFGPFLFDADLARHIEKIPDDLGWGWRFALFVAAHRNGTPVTLVPGNFECPQDQRAESDTDVVHRLTQLGDNVRGILIGVRC
ncbi:MAG TPA: hypothetical protein VNA88_05770 [Candidatus Kapabacteria bacterium]|jgi:hypothetical protein|nr:hypothetical protein [Candidatus Kapabacteria bacterium]